MLCLANGFRLAIRASGQCSPIDSSRRSTTRGPPRSGSSARWPGRPRPDGRPRRRLFTDLPLEAGRGSRSSATTRSPRAPRRWPSRTLAADRRDGTGGRAEPRGHGGQPVDAPPGDRHGEAVSGPRDNAGQRARLLDGSAIGTRRREELPGPVVVGTAADPRRLPRRAGRTSTDSSRPSSTPPRAIPSSCSTSDTSCRSRISRSCRSPRLSTICGSSSRRRSARLRNGSSRCSRRPGPGCRPGCRRAPIGPTRACRTWASRSSRSRPRPVSWRRPYRSSWSRPPTPRASRTARAWRRWPPDASTRCRSRGTDRRGRTHRRRAGGRAARHRTTRNGDRGDRPGRSRLRAVPRDRRCRPGRGAVVRGRPSRRALALMPATVTARDRPPRGGGRGHLVRARLAPAPHHRRPRGGAGGPARRRPRHAGLDGLPIPADARGVRVRRAPRRRLSARPAIAHRGRGQRQQRATHPPRGPGPAAPRRGDGRDGDRGPSDRPVVGLLAPGRERGAAPRDARPGRADAALCGRAWPLLLAFAPAPVLDAVLAQRTSCVSRAGRRPRPSCGRASATSS